MSDTSQCIWSKVCTNVLLSAVVNQINYFRKNFNALFIVSMTICMNKVIISLILLKHPEHSARGRRIRGEKSVTGPPGFWQQHELNIFLQMTFFFLLDPPYFHIHTFRRSWFKDDSTKWKGTIRLWSLKERDKCPMSRANWTFNPLGKIRSDRIWYIGMPRFATRLMFQVMYV